MPNNIYNFNNFKITTENIIEASDLVSIKKFNDWYTHLNNKYFYYSTKHNYYNTELCKIINIQTNILSEIHFILLNHGSTNIELL